MYQEYFSIELSSDIDLAIPLENMGAVIQVETKSICTVPGIANFWYGVVNFKGSLLWILDSNLYFDLNHKIDIRQKKLTAVIVKQYQNDNSNKVAIITPKLTGIITLNPEEIKPLIETQQFSLKQCCSSIAKRESKRIFILNPINLLKHLNQQSSLVSA